MGENAIAFAVVVEELGQGLGIGSFQLVECPLEEIATEFAEMEGELSFEVEGGGGCDGLREEGEDESNKVLSVLSDN